MDFFESQDAARRRTGRLVLLFATAVISIVVLTYLAVAVVFLGMDRSGANTAGPARSLWDPALALYVTGGTLLVIGGGSFYKIAELAAGGKAVARMLGGRPLNSNTADAQERTLLNVVEEMALASGTPVPPVYIIDEGAINAFAAGYSLDDAVIGVTRGALDTLNRDELQGVIAHEFSHILNGDMRLNIRLIGVIHGILAISMIGYIIFRSAATGARMQQQNSRRSKDSGGGPLILLGLLLIIIGYLGVFFGNLIKAAVSRQREYLADAAAVQFTRNPAGIAGALKKIGGWVHGSTLGSASVHEVSHMLFSSGLDFWLSLFATHPPLADRIRRIDPSFDGTFPKVERVRPRPGATQLAQTPLHRREEMRSKRRGRELIREIGRPGEAHVHFARQLLGMIPPIIHEAVHEPFSARAIVLCMVIDRDPAMRERQLRLLQLQADTPTVREVQRLLPVVEKLDDAQRLPVIDMVTPALRAMSLEQYESFMRLLDELVRADEKIALFEWVLQRVLKRHLTPHFVSTPPQRALYYNLKPLAKELAVLLSALAHVGHPSVEEAQRAYAAAVADIAMPMPAMQSSDACSLAALDDALSELEQASPREKRRIMEAAAVCISFDHAITPREAELFRAIGDCLGCPVPPLLAGQPVKV